MPPEMMALFDPLKQATEAGEDVQSHLASLREQLVLAAAPDEAEAINAVLAGLQTKPQDSGPGA